MDDNAVQPAPRTRKRPEEVNNSRTPPPAPAAKKRNRRRKGGEDDDEEDQGDGSDYVETDVDADELDEEEEEPDEKFSDEGDEEEGGDQDEASKPLKPSTQRQLDYLAEGVSQLSRIVVDQTLTSQLEGRRLGCASRPEAQWRHTGSRPHWPLQGRRPR